ncbi:pseudouridylate synthase PUS7L isoform X1 [Osmerus eperlanus]|uniref:pseudouridylate synthase PUS7L isoform X1 n=1 Tax=Osmerus eperlanus TaxID=29151 RepID=UPI002E0DEF44
MEDDPVAASVPVLDSFISDHDGFFGTIKNCSRDFVVTEIDIDGHVVTEDSSSVVSQPGVCYDTKERTSQAPSKRRESASSACRPSLTQDCSIPGVEPTDTAAGKQHDVPSLRGESLDLSLVLGQSTHAELEKFVTTFRNGQKVLAKQELTLGSFPDKLQRAKVHRAVRHHFPFLMTVTSQSEIRVKEDPDYKELSGLVSEEDAENFFRFLDAKVPGTTYTFRPEDRKQNRTAVHHFLSRRFGKLVETKSFSQQGVTKSSSEQKESSQRGETRISVRLRERGKTTKRSAGERREEQEVYTAFTLRKENVETLEAISLMAAALDVVPSDFTYAGIKDKRAITHQGMVVKKVSAQRLMEKAPDLERRGLVLSRVRWASGPLSLGRLQGNHFDLVVRDLRPHPCHGSQKDLAALVQEAVDNVKTRGFVNYYGPQRFGSAQTVQSDEVGLALLKEDMVLAVRLFFTPEEGDDPQNQAKRLFLQTGDAKASLALMPMSKPRERIMLRALHRYGTGPEGCARAWLALPHGMRVFYPHAYCSRVWNHAVAHRLAMLGHKPRQGDLVWVHGDTGGLETLEEANQSQIHVVTREEEEQGVYSLAQVVLPMPGNSVQYPESTLGAWYQARLAQDGLQNCRFRITSLKLNLPGCHRPLLALPSNLTFSLQVLGRGAGRRGGGGEECQLEDDAASPKPQNDTDTACLNMTFDLDTSCYATVCLRELMKHDL